MRRFTCLNHSDLDVMARKAYMAMKNDPEPKLQIDSVGENWRRRVTRDNTN